MDSLEFAIKMELDGEKYYLEQAKKNEGNSLEQVFLMLARDENKHAEVLRKWGDKKDYELIDSEILKEYKNVFEGIEDFKEETKIVPSQLDAYRMALEKEKESIELYEDMLSKTNDSREKELFQFLIKEEKMHYDILDDIVSHISRAEEWVESAEFGLREDY